MTLRPQGHDDETAHSDKVRIKVRTTERGGEPQTREHRNGAVSSKYGANVGAG
jgi:hypothetical protein